MADVVITIALIALIAACAGPRFTRASAEKRLPSMIDDLQMMRCQIELYRIEHDGLLPGQTDVGDDVTCDTFINALTEPGSVRAEPYLRGIPANPFIVDDTADDITIVNSMDIEPCGGGHTGWWFNVASGEFRANNSRFHSGY